MHDCLDLWSYDGTRGGCGRARFVMLVMLASWDMVHSSRVSQAKRTQQPLEHWAEVLFCAAVAQKVH
jgi:hypothetical protein